MATPKSVLITGCSHGSIGHSLATSFARRGFLVFATARNTSKISETLSSQPNVEILTLDTTSQASITSAVNAVSKQTGGRLDYLINNAGSGLVMPFLDTDMEEARKVFEVNFWGVLMCVQGFKELVIRARGTIVNVSSIAGVAPNPYESIYNSSKAALTHFGETLRYELKPLGVNVISLMTGMIRSGWYSNSVPQVELPKDSHYHSVIENINAGMTGVENTKKAMNVDEFAEQVVRDVLNGKEGKLWGGAMSFVVWLASCFPTWVMDKIMLDMSGLRKLENASLGS